MGALRASRERRGRGAAAALAMERCAFETRTPRSRERFERARRVLPGGDTRAATFYAPYPVAIAEAKGVQLTDLDDNPYLDFLLNYTTMIAGHAHPTVIEAATRAARRGSAIAAPVVGQVELAEELTARVESVERVRFVNSGTEAAMAATRVARAFTGRSLIVKAIGGYHGGLPELDAALAPGAPAPPGAPAVRDVVAVPFNDVPALERALDEHGADCAAILLEPVMGAAGVIPPEPGYLAAAERLARAVGALFALDEVITFRLGRGGYQGQAGLRPDLTIFGKLIGGGFPVGAVGGRADVMDLFAPGARGGIVHSGTFNGNAVTVAAGRAALDLLDQSAYERLEALGARLELGIRRAIADAGVAASVTRVGSLLNVHFTSDPPRDAAAAAAAERESAAAFHLGLLNRGVFIAPRGLFALSLLTTEANIAFAVDAVRDVLAGFEKVGTG